MSLSYGFLTASGQIYDVEPDLVQSWIVMQLITHHTVDGSPSAFLRLCSPTFQSFSMKQETPVSHNMIRFVGFSLQHPLPYICLGRLTEGRYLIAHKAGEPFVTLLKAADGKVTRGSYNLQQVHSSVPRPPASGAVPWIPVDPTVVLPFHQRHGRIPCSFPVAHVPKVTEALKTPRQMWMNETAMTKNVFIHSVSMKAASIVLMDSLEILNQQAAGVSFHKSNKQPNHRSSSTGFICADWDIQQMSVRNSRAEMLSNHRHGR